MSLKWKPNHTEFCFILFIVGIYILKPAQLVSTDSALQLAAEHKAEYNDMNNKYPAQSHQTNSTAKSHHPNSRAQSHQRNSTAKSQHPNSKAQSHQPNSTAQSHLPNSKAQSHHPNSKAQSHQPNSTAQSHQQIQLSRTNILFRIATWV